MVRTTTGHSQRRVKMKKFIFAVLLLVAPAFAVADTMGAMGGAAVGGVIGSKVGGKNGKVLATIVLMGAGASIGSRLEDGTYFKPEKPQTCRPGWAPGWAIDPGLKHAEICVLKEEHRASFSWPNGAVCDSQTPIPAIIIVGNTPRCYAPEHITMAEEPVREVNTGVMAAAMKGRGDRMAAEQKQAEKLAYCMENPRAYQCAALQRARYTGGGLFGGAQRSLF